MIGSGSTFTRLGGCAIAAAIGVAAVAVPPAAAGTPLPAVAARPQPAAGGEAAARTGDEIGRVKRELARTLAVSLADARTARRVGAALAAGRVDPLAVSRGAARVAVARANQAILAAKGLPAATGSVLELRLAGRAAATNGPALVAVEVDDDSAVTVPAFDRTGRRYDLDARSRPAGAVAVLGVDGHKALTAGLAVLRAGLAAAGVGGGQPAAKAATAAGGYWTTRVMTVRLGDDEEPWFKGDAEIYTIVTGKGVNEQPQVDVVQMPYLDTDGRTYSPGQILVDWSHYRYNAVDAVMMEEDDGTNYRALAQAIATALLTVLGQAEYVPMVDAVLAAMPDSWWTDDPDYVDSWYLLTRQSNENRAGARGNGVIVFAPYYVSAI